MEDSDGNKEMRRKSPKSKKPVEKRASRGKQCLPGPETDPGRHWVGHMREDREVAIGSGIMGHW